MIVEFFVYINDNDNDIPLWHDYTHTYPVLSLFCYNFYGYDMIATIKMKTNIIQNLIQPFSLSWRRPSLFHFSSPFFSSRTFKMRCSLFFSKVSSPNLSGYYIIVFIWMCGCGCNCISSCRCVCIGMYVVYNMRTRFLMRRERSWVQGWYVKSDDVFIGISLTVRDCFMVLLYVSVCLWASFIIDIWHCIF